MTYQLKKTHSNILHNTKYSKRFSAYYVAVIPTQLSRSTTNHKHESSKKRTIQNTFTYTEIELHKHTTQYRLYKLQISSTPNRRNVPKNVKLWRAATCSRLTAAPQHCNFYTREIRFNPFTGSTSARFGVVCVCSKCYRIFSMNLYLGGGFLREIREKIGPRSVEAGR